MISIDEAIGLVTEQTRRLPAITIERDRAQGHVLADAVVSDVDSPPHHKSLVDGYAVIAADVAQGRRSLRVLETIFAGCLPQHTVTAGTASRIMTGAPLPPGADAVVMHEQTDAGPPGLSTTHTLVDGKSSVNILSQLVAVGQNILPRGSSFTKGDVILPAGQKVRAIEAGLLAEVGCSQVSVFRRPTVAILSTGDELVPPHQSPAPGQIRNSNESLLEGLVVSAGATPVGLGIARDNLAELRLAIEQGLQHDVLVLSGGVSAGDLDLVPSTLQQLGVEQVFHQVDLRPGKPVWFGVRSTSARRTLVFGLPGNPVSVLVCFQLLARPAVRAMGGHLFGPWPWQTVSLAVEHHNRSGRPTFFPSQIRVNDEGRPVARLLSWHGSADLGSLRHADGFVFFPAEPAISSAGSSVRFHALDDPLPASS